MGITVYSEEGIPLRLCSLVQSFLKAVKTSKRAFPNEAEEIYISQQYLAVIVSRKNKTTALRTAVTLSWKLATVKRLVHAISVLVFFQSQLGE